YGIRHIPNFVLFKDGQKIEQFVGSIPAEDFEEKLKGYL
ncbi:thioredoxin family protein, partial [Candidatus Pacearchaeota archaeon]|nr:thioredoxin family protein [Candidatus Pacearchaeota archaeon]